MAIVEEERRTEESERNTERDRHKFHVIKKLNPDVRM